MRSSYIGTIIKRNWKPLLILVLIFIVGGYFLKNLGEIPYENQHLMNSSTPVKFKINGNEIRGFLYLSYWVETDPKEVKGFSTYELDDYISEHGYIDLQIYQEELIQTLKSYNTEQIKENWMDDYEFFKKKNVYYIDNDKKLMNTLKKFNLDVDLDYQLKKIFFVYLNIEKYNNFIESLN